MLAPRWLPLSGIVFVALIVLSVVVGGTTPDPEATGAEVVAFYGDEPLRHRVAAVLLATSVPFLVLFALSLGASRRTAGEPAAGGVWSRLLVTGAGVAAGVIAVSVLLHLAVVDGADGGATLDAVQALNLLDGHLIYALMPALGVMMLGAAGSLLRPERTQRALGWSALVLGIWLYVPFIAFLGLLLSAVWIVVACISMFRRRGAEGSASITA